VTPTHESASGPLPREIEDERGVALVAAVFALAIISALIASSFFAGRLEQQSGRNVIFAAQASEAAEAGLIESMTSLSAQTLDSLSVGGASLDLGTMAIGNGVEVRTRVTRLTSRVLLIRADGQRNAEDAPLAFRSLGLLIQRVTPPSADTADGAETLPAVTRLGERAWLHLY
jgi:hypothetical protein